MKKFLILLLIIFPTVLISQEQTEKEMKYIKSEIEFLKQQISMMEFGLKSTQKKDSMPVAVQMEMTMLKNRLSRIESSVEDMSTKVKYHSHGKYASIAFGLSMSFPGLGAFYSDNNIVGLIELLIEGMAIGYYVYNPTKVNVNLLLGIHVGQALLNSLLVE